MMTTAAKTPAPPYYAVILTSVRTDGDNGYGETAKQMLALASQQPGYLGVESARQEIGITVSYWDSLEAIAVEGACDSPPGTGASEGVVQHVSRASLSC